MQECPVQGRPVQGRPVQGRPVQGQRSFHPAKGMGAAPHALRGRAPVIAQLIALLVPAADSAADSADPAADSAADPTPEHSARRTERLPIAASAPQEREQQPRSKTLDRHADRVSVCVANSCGLSFFLPVAWQPVPAGRAPCLNRWPTQPLSPPLRRWSPWMAGPAVYRERRCARVRVGVGYPWWMSVCSVRVSVVSASWLK